MQLVVAPLHLYYHAAPLHSHYPAALLSVPVVALNIVAAPLTVVDVLLHLNNDVAPLNVPVALLHPNVDAAVVHTHPPSHYAPSLKNIRSLQDMSITHIVTGA